MKKRVKYKIQESQMTQKIIFFITLLLFIASVHMAAAANRTALVIGNSAYKSIDPLQNPVNDATDMKAALEKLGFEVILRTNADRSRIRNAVRIFGDKIKQGGVGLFYYAGHGVQVDGTNFMVPVGVDIKRKYDIEDQGLKMMYVLGAMEEANNKLNIIILDACRDNPFRSFSGRGSARGLARMDAPTGSIIAYATAPGRKAADGVGRNGTYTAQLLKNLENPVLSVQEMLNQTGLDVMRATNNDQVPWISSTPVEKYFLAGGTKEVESERKAIAPAIPSPKDTWKDPVTGMEFVWVPKGCFRMGQSKAEKQYLIKEAGKETYNKFYDDELPRHETCVDGFWAAKTEVTKGQFRQFINQTGYKTDADKKGKAYISNKETDWKWKELPGYNWEKTGYSQDDAHPVVCVSWNDAKEFIKWLSTKTGQNFALPTEAQWAYAARGGTDFMRFWGTNVAEACKYANVADKDNWNSSFPCSDGYQYTSPVGTFRVNPFGLYDMLGNVWEWCEDVYDKNAYSKHDRNNPVITSGGDSRVIRGGSWNSGPRDVRAANRVRDSADIRFSYIGFRLCLSRVRQ